MQLRAEQLKAHLDQAGSKGLRPIYTVWGDEALLVQEACDAIRQQARAQGFSERQVHTVSGAHFDWSSLLGATQSMSLFGDRQLIDIRIPSGKPGKEGSEALQSHAAHTNVDVLTLIQLPRLDQQQQKSAWFSALDQAGVCVRVDTIERAAIPAWISQRLALQGQRVSPGELGSQTLSFMADRVEGNLLAAHQELQKLSLLYPEGELTLAQVEDAVLNVARYSAPKWCEALWAGQIQRSLRMLEGLEAEGESVVMLHWLLTEDLRSLRQLLAAVKGGKPVPLALREARIWGPKEKHFERLVGRLSQTTVAGWLAAAHTCDGINKGLPNSKWPESPWQAMQRLALMILSETAPTTGHAPSPLPLVLAGDLQ